MNEKKVTVLGAGLVGRHIAVDLSDRYDVTAVDTQDVSDFFEDTNVTFRLADIRPETIPSIVAQSDIVVVAVPGHIGYQTLKAVIQCGIDVVDISFMPEDVQTLEELAKEKGVKVITDFGVAPGLCGLLLGNAVAKLKQVDSATIMVGGFPKEVNWPFFYKAPFSPRDVIEEYTRPVRMRRDGVNIIEEPLSDVEEYNDQTDLPLVCFNTDGLRTLLDSFPEIPNMVEKTVRHIGHFDAIDRMREFGFFKPEHLENTCDVLLPQWKLEEKDEDFLTMTIEVTGGEESIRYTLFDEYGDGVSSMARTTGFTCNAGVSILQDLKEPGLYLPEDIGRDNHLTTKVIDYLKERDVNIALTNSLER